MDETSFKESPITRDEALLWLNDRLGKVVVADLRIGYDCVCSTEGNLTYWTDRNPESIAGPTGAVMAEGLTGLYDIGKTVFELTPMAVPWSFAIRQFPVHELVARFESVELRFTPKR
jgi:hypothetical protein